jgi:hypothetical protein
MRLTPILGVRSLIAKLHPPLLKTPRESQQLLSVLDSAFKRQLDEVHPPVNSVKSLDIDKSRPNDMVFANPSVNATNDHLLSILHHPLLETKDGTRAGTASATARAVALLDDAIVQRKVTPELLEQCIIIYKQNGRHLPSVSEGHGLGYKITAWFNLADAATREVFLTGRLMDNVIPLMYSEGQDQVVWEWLRRIYEGDFGGRNDKSAYDPKSPAWQEKEASFVRLMVREAVRRRNLSGAIQEYAQAWNYMVESGRLPQGTRPSYHHSPRSSMFRASMMIVHMIIHRRQDHGVPSVLYDLITRLDKYWSSPRYWQQMFLSIYHPSRPSAEKLLQSLRSADFQQHKLHVIRQQTNPGTSRLATIAMIDAVQLLLGQDQPKKAQFVLDATEKHFPEFASERTSQDSESRIHAAQREVEAKPVELAFG